ncbi:hypothetical protein [Nostoc sp. WHI]|uniref:hypothetical protein n=1 Tax=Nostoc sp. WHI TaxID=2650611 RepID=UPI0018C4B6C4|nr:hypothetical protein [Nostoc sp. WHI]MBG1267864.1 hypothetical protein [Nostoc sp. WHI]
MSRFSEVLGAAQENTQLPGYPESQLSEQLDTQPTEKSSSQLSEQVKSQPPENLATQLPGYPENQPSEHLETQVTEESLSQLSEQVKSQPSENLATQLPGYPENQLSEQPKTQLPENSTTQQPQQPVTRSSKQLKDKDKLAKRENPDYTQTTFRIPKKLSRQINRVLMDLADEGVEVDRSDLLEELANAFIRLADEVGVVKALEKVKNLGTQMDE